jgi:hypothetical protein
MRWLGVTAGLLAASASLVAWVYLRDRDTSGWRLPERQIVRADTAATLTAFAGPDCRPGCAAQLLGRTQPHRWLVRITVRGRSLCLQIDPDVFAVSPRGLDGVQPSRCARERVDRHRLLGCAQAKRRLSVPLNLHAAPLWWGLG